jgi:hypothetical protein
MNNSDFIKMMVEYNKDCKSTFKSVSIAQAIEESGSGTSNLYVLANASYGIKATSTWSGKVYSTATKQVYSSYDEAKKVGGTLYRAYNYIKDSVIDHDKFLQASRYTPVRNAKSYQEACLQLRLCGYCPDDGYETRLMKIITKYNLTQYDEPLEFPFKVKVVYSGKDGVNVRKNPDYKDSSIDNVNGPIMYGSQCTVVELVGDFYKTKSGLYITSNPIYIQRV